MGNALKKITAEAKRLQKKHPNAKWSSLVKQASAKYRAGTIGAPKKAKAKKKRATVIRKKKATVRKRVAKRKRATSAAVVVVSRAVNGAYLKSYSVLLQYDNGDRKTVTIKAANENDARWAARKRPGVYSATVLKRNKRKGRRGSVGAKMVRYRNVGASSKSMLLPVLGIGALALAAVAIFKSNKPSTQLPAGTPPLVLSNNPIRDNKTQDIVGWAMAANLGIDAIIKLINSLNNSNDSDVDAIYNYKNSTGSLPNSLFV